MGDGLVKSALANDSDTDEESEETEPTKDATGVASGIPNSSSTNSNDATPHANLIVRPTTLSEMVETELSRLVNYVQPTRFDSFEAAKKRDRAYEVSFDFDFHSLNLLCIIINSHSI